MASTQAALGVDLNYTDANEEVYFAFQQSVSRTINPSQRIDADTKILYSW